MHDYQQKVQMLHKTAAAGALVKPLISIGGKLWGGAKVAGGKLWGGANKVLGHPIGWIGIPTGVDIYRNYSAKKDAEESYNKLLPLNAKMLKQKRLQDALLYGGSSAAGASLAYYLSEKNKGRNAIIGAVAAPIALHVGRGIYNQLNISPEAYTRRQVGLS